MFRMFRIAFIALLSWPSLCPPAHAMDVVVTVRLQMYAELHPKSLQRAQRDAAAIFHQAGIELRWLSDSDSDRYSASDINLVIVPDQMARNLRRPSDQFGLAVSGGRAYIFLDRLTAFAKGEMIPVNQLLGPVMAHEIGHLLLGPASHFTVGIMHGRWRTTEVKHALMGSLVFTPEQGRVMRADLRKHTRDENLIN